MLHRIAKLITPDIRGLEGVDVGEVGLARRQRGGRRGSTRLEENWDLPRSHWMDEVDSNADEPAYLCTTSRLVRGGHCDSSGRDIGDRQGAY
jgi:hypothetical protein